MEILKLHQQSLLFTDPLTTELTSKRVSVITFRLGPAGNTALLLLLKSFPWERVLLARALSSNGSGIFAYRSLPSNGSTHYSVLLIHKRRNLLELQVWQRVKF
jgi:hypothetical protein